jgi:hypothetical protein
MNALWLHKLDSELLPYYHHVSISANPILDNACATRIYYNSHLRRKTIWSYTIVKHCMAAIAATKMVVALSKVPIWLL